MASYKKVRAPSGRTRGSHRPSASVYVFQRSAAAEATAAIKEASKKRVTGEAKERKNPGLPYQHELAGLEPDFVDGDAREYYIYDEKRFYKFYNQRGFAVPAGQTTLVVNLPKSLTQKLGSQAFPDVASTGTIKLYIKASKSKGGGIGQSLTVNVHYTDFPPNNATGFLHVS